MRLESAPGLGTHIGLSIPLALEARHEPDPKLAGLNVFMALPDGKLHHTLRLHLLSLGLRLCEAPQGAHLLFGDLNEPAAIRVAPLGNVLGYQLRDDGHYCLNSNPLTWLAVRDVCYRQLCLAEQLPSDFPSVGADEPLLPQRLLVVEDHHLNQVLVQRQLKQLNLQCDLAENGRQALAMLTFHRYDLILCDCQMPVMDGYEFTRRVRAIEGLAQLPIIAMTANVLPEQAQRCLAAGMNDVLGKPVLMDGLRQMLMKWQILPVPRLLDINLLQAAFGTSFETMLVPFRQELEQSLGLSHEDDKALADWVHRQAGTIAMMRVDGVAEQAWHLEEQIHKDGRAGCEGELMKFRDVLQQLVDELAALSQDCRQPAVAL